MEHTTVGGPARAALRAAQARPARQADDVVADGELAAPGPHLGDDRAVLVAEAGGRLVELALGARRARAAPSRRCRRRRSTGAARRGPAPLARPRARPSPRRRAPGASLRPGGPRRRRGDVAADDVAHERQPLPAVAPRLRARAGSRRRPTTRRRRRRRAPAAARRSRAGPCRSRACGRTGPARRRRRCRTGARGRCGRAACAAAPAARRAASRAAAPGCGRRPRDAWKWPDVVQQQAVRMVDLDRSSATTSLGLANGWLVSISPTTVQPASTPRSASQRNISMRAAHPLAVDVVGQRAADAGSIRMRLTPSTAAKSKCSSHQRRCAASTRSRRSAPTPRRPRAWPAARARAAPARSSSASSSARSRSRLTVPGKRSSVAWSRKPPARSRRSRRRSAPSRPGSGWAPALDAERGAPGAARCLERRSSLHRRRRCTAPRAPSRSRCRAPARRERA